jgi:hypothetical protein
MDQAKFEAAVKAAGGKIGFLNKGFYYQILATLPEGERIIAAGECIDGKGPGAIIVTDRNFYTAKGTGMLSAARVTIPLDKISSFSRSSAFGNELRIAEGTVNHAFPQVSNLDGIIAAIQPAKATPQGAAASPDPAAELRKYKALLDDGVITQDDFDKKKAALLGL